MRSKTDSEENLAASVTPAAAWRVVHVEPLPGYRLSVRFRDGSGGEIDMAGLIQRPDSGVFAVLKDPAVFEAVHVQQGVVTWPGEVDLAPDAMYDAIRAAGRWVLT